MIKIFHRFGKRTIYDGGVLYPTWKLRWLSRKGRKFNIRDVFLQRVHLPNAFIMSEIIDFTLKRWFICFATVYAKSIKRQKKGCFCSLTSLIRYLFRKGHGSSKTIKIAHKFLLGCAIKLASSAAFIHCGIKA